MNFYPHQLISSALVIAALCACYNLIRGSRASQTTSLIQLIALSLIPAGIFWYEGILIDLRLITSSWIGISLLINAGLAALGLIIYFRKRPLG